MKGSSHPTFQLGLLAGVAVFCPFQEAEHSAKYETFCNRMSGPGVGGGEICREGPEWEQVAGRVGEDSLDGRGCLPPD